MSNRTSSRNSKKSKTKNSKVESKRSKKLSETSSKTESSRSRSSSKSLLLKEAHSFDKKTQVTDWEKNSTLDC